MTPTRRQVSLVTAFLQWKRVHKQFAAAAADLVLLPLAFLSAIRLRYETIDGALLEQYALLLLAAPLFSLPIFMHLGLYRTVVRYMDQKIVGVVVTGVTASVLCMLALVGVSHLQDISRGVFGIYWLVANTYVLVSRLLARGYILRLHGFHGARRVAIYGAGEAGAQLARALHAGLEYLPVAFVDDNPDLHGINIAGSRVYPPERLPDLVRRFDIKMVLVAMPSLNHAQQRRIFDRLEPLHIRTLVTPPIASLVDGQAAIQNLRDIEIEDLLGRDSVAPDENLLARGVAGKTIMITGAGGSIGSELCRQVIAREPVRMILFELSEFALYTIEQELIWLRRARGSAVEIVPLLGSVLETARCQAIMQTYAVETVYHAAAYKHVPLVEHNPVEGIRNNVFGTLALAEAARAAGVRRFTLISTDKAVRPTNVMGATKRLAELVLQGLARLPGPTRFSMVRFGNVLDSSGSVVPLFRKQILAGGPVTVTHGEMTRYFMTIPEAAQLVLQASEMAEGGDVFVLDMGEPVKVMDLARRMIHLSGYDIKSDDNPEGAIEIQQIGLRPGEKLYEELLIGDNVVGTDHPLILRAQEGELPWPTLARLLAELREACDRADHEALRALLLQGVVGYAPQGGIEDWLWRARQAPVAGPASQAVGSTTAAVPGAAAGEAGPGAPRVLLH